MGANAVRLGYEFARSSTVSLQRAASSAAWLILLSLDDTVVHPCLSLLN